jgi:hypothetical protein
MSATRQQALQAIYALLYGTAHTARERLGKPVPARLAASIRRLLEEDLARARASRSPSSPLRAAFYDELPSGKGHEVEYSPFRVFNLFVAHELARFGCKQGEVVEFVAELQNKLRDAFDTANASQATDGRTRLTQSNSDESQEKSDRKIYLVMRRVEATESAVAYFGDAVKAGERLCSSDVLYGREKFDSFLSDELCDGLFGAFVMELSEPALRIAELLRDAPVRRRGRPPSQSVASEAPSGWDDVLKQARLSERGHVR